MKQLTNSNIKNNILEVKKNEREGIYNWGIGNNHPQLVDSLYKVSVSAKNAANLVAKAIYKKSFGRDYNSIIVNSRNQNINDILRIASREYAKHNNVFFLIGYNLEGEIKSIEVIPSAKVRVGKTDDGGYTGTYKVSDAWGDRDSKVFEYDSFNPAKSVIKTQIERSKGITNYKGQILHLQQDANAIYSESDLNVVLKEAVIQMNSQEFRLNGSEEGFLNTKLAIVKPFADDESRRQFKRTLNENRGSKNSGGVIVLEASLNSDDLKEELHLADLTSPYDDKLFEYSDSQAKKNIAEAFSVPAILMGETGESVFANSGELLKQARKELDRSREEERDMIEGTIRMLMEKFVEEEYRTLEYKIIGEDDNS